MPVATWLHATRACVFGSVLTTLHNHVLLIVTDELEHAMYIASSFATILHGALVRERREHGNRAE